MKEIHTVEHGWKKHAEKLCRDFQSMGGEMIIVARQPNNQLFACCTSNAEESMLKNFNTFKECLQFSQRSLKLASGATQSQPNNNKAKTNNETQIKGGKKVTGTTPNKQENVITETSLSKTPKESKAKILPQEKFVGKSQQKDEVYCGLDLEVTEEPGPNEVLEELRKTNHKTDTLHAADTIKKSKTKTSNTAETEKKSDNKNKPVTSAVTTQSLTQSASERTANEGNDRNSQKEMLLKKILAKKPSVLSRQPITKTPSKSEGVPVCKASDIVIQISVTSPKSHLTNTDTVSMSIVSEGKLVSETSSVTSKIVLPVFLSSKEAILTTGVGGKGNGTAHTVTTSSFTNPMVSTLASHIQKETTPALKSKEGQEKVGCQKGTSPNMNMVLLGSPNQFCLVQQPSKEGTVQLAANQMPVLPTKLLLTSSQAQSGQTTSSALSQSGLVLAPSSQTSIGTTHVASTKATTTTPLKILPAVLKGDHSAAQIKKTPEMLKDTAPPTSLPNVFILAAPNSISSALKANSSGFILPMSATPNSTVSQAGATSAMPSISTVTSPAITRGDNTNPASQLLVSFVKKELQGPSKGDEKSKSKEESSPMVQSKEKVSVSPLKESRLPNTMGSFVKIGNDLYQLVVKGGQQLLIPTQQQLPKGKPVMTASTDSQRTLQPPKVKKRKLEEGKDSEKDSGKKLKTSKAPPLNTPTNVHVDKFEESESDPEEEDLSEINKMLQRKWKSSQGVQVLSNESSQASTPPAPVNQLESSTSENENEQGYSTNQTPNLSNLQARGGENGYSTNPQPNPSILQNSQPNPSTIQAQTDDHGYSVQQVDIPPVLCYTCSFKACYWKPMADHMRHHGSNRYCIKCNSFMNSYKFNAHNCTRRGTYKSRKQICLICSRLAGSAIELIKHYRVSHRTEIEKHCHSNSLYRSVRSQKIFVCKGCATLEYSEHSMLSHIKKVHICAPLESKDQQIHLLQKREPVCVCPVCWFHFPEKEHLNYHINLFHIGKSSSNDLECSLCDDNFSSKEELLEHYTTHKPNIKYNCAICAQHKEPMNSLEEVQHHRNIIHPTNKLCALLLCPEPQCQETFQDDIDFVNHVIQHAIGTKYSHTCCKCDFSTSSENMLTKHDSKFHYESEKRCHVCTKRFKMPAELTKHMDTHRTILKNASDTFVCDRCGEIHTDIAKHRRHMRKHRDRDHKASQPCNVCGEIFVSAQNVAKHMFKCHPDVEYDIQPLKYPCAYCDYVSLNRGDFRRHMSTHKKTKPFVCKMCDRNYKHKAALRLHLRQHNQGQYNKKFRCFACHIDRDGSKMKLHLQTENHKLNCKLAGINLDDYNKDLLNLFPPKLEALKLPRKPTTPISYINQCQKIHEEHRRRASLHMVEEKSYTVLTPDGDEIQFDMPSKNPKCGECGLFFKSTEQLEEHREHVRLLELSSTRNNFVCEVCDIHLFEKIGVANHAASKDHIEKCRMKGVETEEILRKNNISKDVWSKKRKELPTNGYRCKICDAFFTSRVKKAVHIDKDIHVKKCQELGVDPAGDHFEDFTSPPNNEEKLPGKEKKKVSRIEKAIKKRKMRLSSIELMGVQVPKQISFECLVCRVMLGSRTQGIDHLNTPMHLQNCSGLGIKSTPGNLTVRVSDIQSVVGKSIPQLLGVASDTVFPISEAERAVYVRQIVEAETLSKTLSGIKYHIVKIRPDLDDAEVVEAELLDKDLETSQESTKVPPETVTAVNSIDPQAFGAAEESPLDTAQEISFLTESTGNSVLSDTKLSVHQGHSVPTSVLSPKQRNLNMPIETGKNTLRYNVISKEGDFLQPSSNQQIQYESLQEVEVEPAMMVDQIFYEDVNEVEISENSDFETVIANELNHFDSF